MKKLMLILIVVLLLTLAFAGPAFASLDEENVRACDAIDVHVPVREDNDRAQGGLSSGQGALACD